MRGFFDNVGGWTGLLGAAVVAGGFLLLYLVFTPVGTSIGGQGIVRCGSYTSAYEFSHPHVTLLDHARLWIEDHTCTGGGP